MVTQLLIPSEPTYLQEDGLEDFEEYSPGGFHPTSIGDKFHNDRYQVLHKLSFGSYSTIWLAFDSVQKRYVAMKMAVAYDKTKEADILIAIHQPPKHRLGQQFIASLLDHFWINGPNGDHQCLVLDPARTTVAQSKSESPKFKFSVEAARSNAAQLIMGVAYLHSLGIFHGDLYPQNFLLYDDENIQSMSLENLRSQFRLDQVPIQRVDG